MKKNLFLTLMLAVLCTATAWAEFSPKEGQAYSLQLQGYYLYMDVETKGKQDTEDANCISLSSSPVAVYFEKNESTGNWKIKNAYGEYIGYGISGGEHSGWNAAIGRESNWYISMPETDIITISDGDSYIGVETPAVGGILYRSATDAMNYKFKISEYRSVAYGGQFAYTLKSPAGTYLQLDLSITDVEQTQTKHDNEKHKFNVEPRGDKYLLKDIDSGKYIAYDVIPSKWGGFNTWGAGANDGSKNATWFIDDFDDDGYAHISRIANVWDASVGSIETVKYLGTPGEIKPGDGVYTNQDKTCNPWFFEGSIEYPVVTVENNGKYLFASGNIYYALPFNKLRFTLTANNAPVEFNNSCFDSFVLYDINGNQIALAAENFIWSESGFEIELGSIDFCGAFSFYFVTANTDLNVQAFSIDAYYRSDVYTLEIDAPQGVETPVVTYDNQPVTAGTQYSIGTINTALFGATEIDGYTWSVVVDTVNRKIIIRYTPVTPEIPDTPVADLSAVVELIKRVGGDAAAEKFEFVLDAGLDTTEAFEISGNNGKIRIKGTTISAITTGIGWYLNNHAHINIAWNSLNEKTASGAAYADLSGITAPTTTERHTCDAKYRYYLNYCTFGYSMSTWDWKRWQQEIDWMALHGVNMPLQIVGLEEVWRKFLVKYNYSATEAKAFVPGPAFTAWWAMNNLEGWGGTKSTGWGSTDTTGWGGVQDDAWYERQANLAKQILDRQRALGMEPVLPGFSGMVPSNFQEKTGVVCNADTWCGFTRPKIVLPSNESFAKIAADYYACLKEVMGESQYYSMDPFHEGGSIEGGTEEQYKAAYKKIYDAMEATKPGAQWLIQQWQWNHKNPNFQAYSITAVPAGRLIVLDLFSDGMPEFDYYGGYTPQDAIYCSVPNFGGRSGLMGRLQSVVDNYFYYKDKYTSLKGLAAIPEAIEQAPVAYDLLYQLPWMESKPNVEEWVKNYTVARYGVENAEVKAAWDLIRRGPLNYGADAIQGPVEDVWAARPNLEALPASKWGKTLNDAKDTYNKERQLMLIEAVYRLLSQNSSIKQGSIYESNYNYDVVEFTSAAIADYAYYLLLGIKEAKDAAGNAFANDAKFIARRDAFLQVIRDMDSFKGTNLNFRLGKWTGQACAAAGEVQNATTATADWYEFNNARTLITTWGDYWQNYAGLRDYSYRSWQGLLKDYYLPRWEYYFANNCKHPGVSDEMPDGDAQNYFFFEWNWAHGMTHSVGDTQVSATILAQGAAGYSYSATPEGNTVTLANGLLGSYIIPVKIDGNTHYLYRHLSNDLTSVYRVNVEQGAVVNFAGLIGDLFGDLTNATISGGFIESGDDATSIKVRNNAANGVSTEYGAVITLADQTAIAFSVVVRPAELNSLPQTAGVYHIKYGGNPIFLAYANKGELVDPYTDLAGYHLVNPNAEGVPAAAQGDKLFTITYNSEKGGYTLSAQGMYLHSTPAEPNIWQSMILSADNSQAGVFLFEESGAADVYKLRSDRGEWHVRYVNSWGKAFGNDMYYKEGLSTFTIERVTEYMLTIPAGGVAALCLPFNVVLPAGVEAYDVTAVGDDDNGNTVYGATLLAESGEKVKAGTPVLIKGTPGTYALGVTVDGTNAIGSLHGSLLIGNYVKRSLVPGNGSNLYTLNGDNATFNLLDAETEIAANSAWLELGEAIETPIPEGDPAEVVLPAETPVAGKVYRIRNYIKSRYIVNDRLNIALPMAVEDDDMSALWVCTGDADGECTFVSALGTAALGWCGLAENAVGFTLYDGVGNGTSAMWYNGAYLAVAVDDVGAASLASSNDKVQAANLSTDWYFEPVNDATVVFERAFVSGYHWGTLYLPYAVKVPENMAAYYATVDDVNVANKVITLNNVGKVIPASTPVLLNRSENMNASYRFEYTHTQEVATAVDGNIFEGRIMQSLVECVEGKNYYMLLKAGNGEAFYWVFKEYDANGNLYPEQNKTHIKCEANKAYFAFASQGANVAAFSFRVGEGTTEIDDVKGEDGNVKTIYDLQGRKLNKITTPGIYIVNGKKVVVK